MKEHSNKDVGPPLLGSDSLSSACRDEFNTPLCDLPKTLRQPAEQAFPPTQWDNLETNQHRGVAQQLDCPPNPGIKPTTKFWSDFFERRAGIQSEIERLKPSRSDELEQKLGSMEARLQLARGDYYPLGSAHQKGREATTSFTSHYLPYPKAIRELNRRLGATPEELVAWVLRGPDDGGIAAYINANELDPPPRFQYAAGSESQDYMTPLMACWFHVTDIAQYEPADRYIGGKALIQRWSQQLGLTPSGFIQAKIAESRLFDIHPVYGRTQGAYPAHSDFPPLESGLFSLSDVERIEARDFALAVAGDDATRSSANQPDAGDHCSVFLAMESLTASELSISFVGDRAESGLGANNMLEIAARGETRRVPLAALDLVDRRQGSLNSQGVILLGMAGSMKLTHSERNAATMSRLRRVFIKRLGVQGDSFERYRKHDGWVPQFKIADKRGAADERAKREAERRTASYEQLNERGDRFSDDGRYGQPLDDEGDAASTWLRDNDPEASA